MTDPIDATDEGETASSTAPIEPEEELTGIDGAIAEAGSFVLAFSRTWGLQLFKPFRASAILEADREDGHPRYVTAPTFLFVGALLVGFGVGSPPDFNDLTGWLTDSAEMALKALEFDEDSFYLFFSAVLQAITVYLAARIGGLLGPRALRKQSTRVLTYALTTSQLGSFAALLAVAVLLEQASNEATGGMVGLVLFIWVLVISPTIAIGTWVRSTHQGWRKGMRLLGIIPFLFTAYIAMFASQVLLYAEFESINTAKVWLDAVDEPSVEDGWYHVELAGLLDAGDVAELCPVQMCAPEWTKEELADPSVDTTMDRSTLCVGAKLSREWMAPGELVDLRLSVKKDDFDASPLGSMEGIELCCIERKESCYSGFSWGMWDKHIEAYDPTPKRMAIDEHAEREKLFEHVGTLATAQRAYHAAFDVYVPAPLSPRSIEELDAIAVAWPMDVEAFNEIGWMPDDKTFGSYQVEVSADGTKFLVTGVADLDGDGVPCVYTVDQAGRTNWVSGMMVY